MTLHTHRPTQTFQTRLFSLGVMLLVLIIYSSEIKFMPNYQDRPDKWHLLYPIVVFYPILIIQVLIILLKTNLGAQKTELLLISIFAILSFVFLNTLNHTIQLIAYISLLAIFAYSLLRIIQLRLKQVKN